MNPVVLRPFASIHRPAFATMPQSAGLLLPSVSANNIKFGSLDPEPTSAQGVRTKEDLKKPVSLAQRIHNELIELHKIFGVLYCDGVHNAAVLPQSKDDIVHESLSMARKALRTPSKLLHPDPTTKELSKEAIQLVSVLSGYAKIINDLSFEKRMVASGQKIHLSVKEIQELCGTPARVSRLNELITEITSPPALVIHPAAGG